VVLWTDKEEETMGKKYKLLACESMEEEIKVLLPECKNTVDVVFVDKALHSTGQIKMLARLQEAIDEVDTTGYDALLLGYGLCNNGICGLHADIPMVVPRAHDCITLFMGSKEKYREYFDTHKGAFFMSAGSDWQDLLDGGFSKEKLRAEYVEKYGEEDAEYLMETLGDPLKEYRMITFVNDGVGKVDDARVKARAIANSRSWDFDEFPGSADLFRRFLNGDWDSADFLVTPPGSVIQRSFSEEEIVKAGPA
jgi:hypothetical protein